MIYVYYSHISKENHDALMRNYLNSFPKDFQIKLLRYHRWQNMQLSVLGRVLLNWGLRKIPFNIENHGVNIKYFTNGKPYLEDSEIKFNISHSGKIAVCVITTLAEIGVDVEQIQPIKIEEFREQMTDHEWYKINSTKQKLKSFYRYWTEKEAVIKANGNGLFIPLKSFEIIYSQSNIDGQKYLVGKINLATNYICHYAIKDNFNHSLPKTMLSKVSTSEILKEPAQKMV